MSTLLLHIYFEGIVMKFLDKIAHFNAASLNSASKPSTSRDQALHAG